ncbi:MAG TPA: hypothetical protein VJT08_09150 [Terriglobales bacterium]|nr:hypothetical protein [Terriglobales bacterium]
MHKLNNGNAHPFTAKVFMLSVQNASQQSREMLIGFVFGLKAKKILIQAKPDNTSDGVSCANYKSTARDEGRSYGGSAIRLEETIETRRNPHNSRS